MSSYQEHTSQLQEAAVGSLPCGDDDGVLGVWADHIQPRI